MDTAKQKIERMMYNTPRHDPAYPILKHADNYMKNRSEVSRNQLKQQFYFSLMIYEELIRADVVEIVNRIID